MKTKDILRIVNMVLAFGLITYAIIFGLSATLPHQGPTNGQTSRNLFFHVPMWFAMMVMGYTSVVYSIKYLRKMDPRHDVLAKEAAKLTVLFGVLGLLTGIVWSRVTWGQLLDSTDPVAWWPWEPKQTAALICVLIYLGFFLVRSSFTDPVQRAKVSSVFNIFAAASIYPLLYVIPKVLPGLHPNTGGDESAIGTMSPGYYYIFWPAVIGFVLVAVWLLDVRGRIAVVNYELNSLDDE